MNNLLTRIVRSSFIIVLLFTSIAAAPLPSPIKQDTETFLQNLGGFQCFEDSIFTCVTIDVPLDHFNPSDTRTIPVTFAVLPASGVRKGMFVTATGGPGYSGIASADSYTEAFDPSIPEAFDIVFFDQRGIALLWRSVLSQCGKCLLSTGCKRNHSRSGSRPQTDSQNI